MVLKYLKHRKKNASNRGKRNCKDCNCNILSINYTKVPASHKKWVGGLYTFF